MGAPCEEFEIVKAQPPLDRFTHVFSLAPSEAARADLVIVNLRGLDAPSVLDSLRETLRKDAQLILLAESGQVPFGAVSAVLCEVSMFLGEKVWTDFTGIIAAVLLAYALMTVLSDGIWNIAEAINGIKMVGMPELAGMNYIMAGVNLVAIVAAIVTCFTKKSN